MQHSSKTSFDRAVSLAEGIARRKTSERGAFVLFTALTYYPGIRPHWTAYFSVEEEGGSFVDVEDGVSFERHLDDFDTNWYEAKGEDENDAL